MNRADLLIKSDTMWFFVFYFVVKILSVMLLKCWEGKVWFEGFLEIRE